MKKNIFKMIDIDCLPHKKSLVDWKKSVGYSVKFQYGFTTGYITILEWCGNRKIKVKYLDNVMLIEIAKFAHCQIASLINYRNYDWVYQVGDIIPDNIKSSGIVTNRFYKQTCMSMKGRFYQIQCNKCNQLFVKFENDLNKTGCPICSNRTVVSGVNDIWTTNPEIAEQLANPLDGYKYTIGQRVYLDWVCKKCNTLIYSLTPMQVNKTLDHMVPCKCCSDAYSFPNKLMFNILTFAGIHFDPEKTFDWVGLGQRRYDFYLPDYNMICELNGGLHYDKRFPETRINDQEKYELAINNGITKYIVVDCQKSDVNYIVNNLRKTELDSIIDFDSLDFKVIEKNALYNIEKESLELLKSHNFDVLEVSQILRINRATVSKYLNKAIRLDIFDVNHVRECQRQNKIKKHYQLEGQPVLCKELGLVFGTMHIIADYFKEEIPRFSSGSMCQAIARNGTAYGYHWKRITRSEFNRIKTETPDKAFGDIFENIQDIDKLQEQELEPA